MMTALRLHDFRTFRKFKVEGLTRVSLLVGANNAGKTSVLDAAELLLVANGLNGVSLSTLGRSALRRGETAVTADMTGTLRTQVELSHLFHGHTLGLESSFKLEADMVGTHQEATRYVSCDVVSPKASPPAPVFLPPLLLSKGLQWTGASFILRAALRPAADMPIAYTTPQGGIPIEAVGDSMSADSAEAGTIVSYLGTEPARPARLHALWDRVVLKPEEARVTEVLRIIEPNIERLAALSTSVGPAEGRMFVKFKGSDQRIPLGSLGEGIRRLLVLSLNLVNSAGGYLLVDEIDTGLHHSVMVKMWRLVVEAARRLNVQVLATTHSLDCVQALAALYDEQHEVHDLISLHRIERGAEASVPYSADELLAAARHQMELR
jgi:hypothetical protein